MVTFLAAGSAMAAEFILLAPAEESFLGQGEVQIIGKVDGSVDAKMVEIFDNGKTLGFAPLRRGSFTFKTKLSDGKHDLVLAAPGVKRLTIKALVGKQEGYAYHIDISEADPCIGCHAQARAGEYRMSNNHADKCYECHDNKTGPEFVHGPVNAGSCTPCHDPHGSRYDTFLRAGARTVCLYCHSHNMSKAHIEERRNRECTSCHDPHSSAKEFHLK
jgi:predicted CXXCH cytochrome family protein